MTFRIVFTDDALLELRKIDVTQRKRIVKWLEKNIDGCDDPRRTGKLLSGDLTGLWRYRIGDYRVICDIRDEQLVVLVIKVGPRGQIYKRS